MMTRLQPLPGATRKKSTSQPLKVTSKRYVNSSKMRKTSVLISKKPRHLRTHRHQMLLLQTKINPMSSNRSNNKTTPKNKRRSKMPLQQNRLRNLPANQPQLSPRMNRSRLRLKPHRVSSRKTRLQNSVALQRQLPPECHDEFCNETPPFLRLELCVRFELTSQGGP